MDPNTELNLPETMALRDAAKHLGVSYRTLKDAIDAGDLRASQLHKERGGWVVQRQDVLAYLDAKATRGQGQPIRPELRPTRHRPRPAGGGLVVRDDMGRVA